MTRIHVTYFKAKEGEAEAAIPYSFVYEDAQGEHIYGLPALEYPGLVKVSSTTIAP